jgi:NAD(P)-dependent dehydrogenase (short-subunit alcohol dehydrogenase family)
VIADVDEDGGNALASSIGDAARFIVTDVGDRGAIERLAADAVAWRGGLDLVISNAAIACTGPPHEFSVDDWHRIIDVDLMAGVWLMRATLPHLLERGAGHISFVSSGRGLHGASDDAPYAVAKFGLIGLAECVARYVRGTGVSASVVVPGGVADETHAGWRTHRFAGVDPADVGRLRDELRARRWERPASMARDIVEGIEAGRFHIPQRGHGEHEGWFERLLQDKADDPDAFVLARPGA